MTVTGPVQPFVGGGAVQENFRQMVDHVLSYNPDCPPQLARRRLNTRLRMIQDRRMWGGLLVRGEISVPAAYTTGTVTCTKGSDQVAGVGTFWPYKDLVETTLAVAVTVIGELQDLTPNSMAGIAAGDWLAFDAGGVSPGGPNKEYMLVVSTSSTTFKARPTKLHSVGETIWKSSLVRRQFRLGTTRPFYHIRGVSQALELKLDLPWGHPNSSGSAYQICQAYVTMEQSLRMVWSVVNTAQGWRLRLNMPQEVLNTYDTWRQTTGWVYMLVDYVPDEIGRMQYELYPTPSMEQAFPYLAYRTVPNLVDDEDTPPPCIPSHLLVHGGLADVMLYNRKSPYYDPTLAQGFAAQYEMDLQAAAQSDDNIYMQNLMWAYNRYPFGEGRGAAWYQSHDAGPDFI